MTEPIRFRNHISIVAEQIWRNLIFLTFVLIGGFARPLSDLTSAVSEMTDTILSPALTAAAAVLFILLLYIGWRILVWSKTYISVQDNALVIERNTLNRCKHTIGISNISNINTEQNLFEMLLGTCKLKLDTNSLSTANKTDVTIVLKATDAEAFRAYLLSFLEDTGIESEEENESAYPREYVIRAQAGDIAAHGFFSINLFSLLVLAGCLIGAVTGIHELIEDGFSGHGIVSLLISSLLLISMFASAFWDIARGFIRYYDFRVFRKNDKLYIRYGLLKKASYTIPVHTIHALKLSQTLAARLAGRYMAEIVNVGMGDEENEKNSFLVLYCKQDQLEKALHKLLPEYAGSLSFSFPRQPKTVWIAWICPLLLYLGILAAAFAAAWFWLPGFRFWIMAALMTGLLLAPITLFLRYRTAGMKLQPDFLLTSSGYCRRSILMVPNRQIQFVELLQNPLARMMHIQKGQIHLLASALNQVHGIPYFREKESSQIRERLLHSKEFSEYTDISKRKGERDL